MQAFPRPLTYMPTPCRSPVVSFRELDPAAAGIFTSPSCGWEFSRYVPSPWEQDWLDAGASRHDSICDTMKQPDSVAASEEWMTAVDETFHVDDVGPWVQKQQRSQVPCCDASPPNPRAPTAWASAGL